MRNPSPAFVSEGARVHPSAQLSPGVFVGPDVEIGAETVVGPNATIEGRVRIGCRVVIGPGAAIGCRGFGYEKQAGAYRYAEHTGEVVIEDDVEIGANSTVAAARAGRTTRIGRGTKIDCQVHIAHNVSVGCDCIIVAQSGLAGSVSVGDRTMIAGQSGVRDHVTIGEDSVLYARSALFRSIPAGSRYSGIPARPHAAMLRFWARLWRMFGGGE